MVDRVAGPAAAAAELDHRQAEARGCRWPRRSPSRPAATSAISGAPARCARSRRGSRPGRRAPPPSARSARPRRRRRRPRAMRVGARPRRRREAGQRRGARRRARRSRPRAGRRSTSPRRKRAAFAISSALPAAVASGSFMSVMSARVGQPAPFATSTSARRERPRVVQRRHEGAGAGLDVEDQRVEPGGELLRQDRGGDEVDQLDRAGDVADGVEAAVGRGDVGGLADDGAADLAHHAARRSRRRAGWRSRGSRRTCRACRRYGRGRGRRSSARRRRRRRAPARASG